MSTRERARGRLKSGGFRARLGAISGIRAAIRGIRGRSAGAAACLPLVPTVRAILSLPAILPTFITEPMIHDLAPEWLQHFIATYGLWAVFIFVTLESAGIPMPGETALVSAALFAGSTHQLDITSIVAVAASGAIIGDNLGYLVGRTIGLSLVLRYGRHVGLTEDRLLVGQYLFLKHGGKIVFFGRFVAFLRAFAAVLAGIDRMPWPHFLVMNALGGICWASLFGFGAYALGEEIEHVAGPIGLAFLAVAIVLMVAAVVYFKRHEKELEERARAELAAHVAGD